MMLPKTHLTSHSRMSGPRVITPYWLSGSLRSFLYSSSVYFCQLFLISFPTLRSIPCLFFIVPVFVWNLKSSGIWLQIFHRTRETETLGRHKQNFVCTRTQEKGELTAQETESDLTVSVPESPAEAWVDSGQPSGQGHWLQQSWEAWHAGISPSGGGHHYPYHSLAPGQTSRR